MTVLYLSNTINTIGPRISEHPPPFDFRHELPRIGSDARTITHRRYAPEMRTTRRSRVFIRPALPG